MKRRKSGYGTDIFDMTMVMDEPKLLNKKGLKKRRSWKRRGFM